jgi:hypothetical protein
MSVSVVNGFVCYSCGDVAKAKRGEDPHPTNGADAVGGHKGVDGSHKNASPHDGPAVTFGGTLVAIADATSADAAPPATAVQSADAAAGSAQNTLDILI